MKLAPGLVKQRTSHDLHRWRRLSAWMCDAVTIRMLMGHLGQEREEFVYLARALRLDCAKRNGSNGKRAGSAVGEAGSRAARQPKCNVNGETRWTLRLCQLQPCSRSTFFGLFVLFSCGVVCASRLLVAAECL